MTAHKYSHSVPAIYFVQINGCRDTSKNKWCFFHTKSLQLDIQLGKDVREGCLPPWGGGNLISVVYPPALELYFFQRENEKIFPSNL